MSEQDQTDRGAPTDRRERRLSTMTNAIGHAWAVTEYGLHPDAPIELKDQEVRNARAAAERVLRELEELGVVEGVELTEHLEASRERLSAAETLAAAEALANGAPEPCELHNLDKPCPKCEEQETRRDSLHNSVHPAVAEMLTWFEHDHLPPWLQDVVQPFAILAKCLVARAEWQIEELDEASALSTDLGLLASVSLTGPELTVALRKLLEAKDAACRARIAARREARPDRPGRPGGPRQVG